MVRRAALLLAFALWANITSMLPARAYLPPPLASFHHDAVRLARHVPGAIALEMLDLNTGYHAGFNAARSMPAASTIKLPVMVEVFNQLQAGRFDLNHRVTLQRSDRDYGSGVICDAPLGIELSRLDAAREDDRHQRQHRNQHADPSGRAP